MKARGLVCRGEGPHRSLGTAARRMYGGSGVWPTRSSSSASVRCDGVHCTPTLTTLPTLLTTVACKHAAAPPACSAQCLLHVGGGDEVHCCHVPPPSTSAVSVCPSLMFLPRSMHSHTTCATHSGCEAVEGGTTPTLSRLTCSPRYRLHSYRAWRNGGALISHPESVFVSNTSRGTDSSARHTHTAAAACAPHWWCRPSAPAPLSSPAAAAAQLSALHPHKLWMQAPCVADAACCEGECERSSTRGRESAPAGSEEGATGLRKNTCVRPGGVSVSPAHTDRCVGAGAGAGAGGGPGAQLRCARFASRAPRALLPGCYFINPATTPQPSHAQGHVGCHLRLATRGLASQHPRGDHLRHVAHTQRA